MNMLRRNPALWLVPVPMVLWLLTVLGLDRTNYAQAQDFLEFHYPTIRWFADQPLWIAVLDYNAAPFPLFYMVFGALFAAVPDLAALHAASLLIGLGVLVTTYHVLRIRGADEVAIAAILLSMLISPYFRGPVVFVNTDAMPVLFFNLAMLALFAGEAHRSSGDTPRSVAVAALAILAAFGAFYVRQFYAFLPAAVLLTLALDADPRTRAVLAAWSGILALPALCLLLLWGGPMTPTLQENHIRPGALPSTLIAVLTNFGLYASVLLAVTLLCHRGTLWLALTDRRFLVGMAVIVPLVVAAAVWHVWDPTPQFAGGGLVMKAFDLLFPPALAHAAALAAFASAAAGYALYLILQNPRRNLILGLFLLAMLPTSTIFQRYFDPILPLIFVLALDTREVRTLLRTRLSLLFPALAICVSLLGLLYYR